VLAPRKNREKGACSEGLFSVYFHVHISSWKKKPVIYINFPNPASQAWWYTPVIPATWEAEVRRIAV
jgi:hypothetical protein